MEAADTTLLKALKEFPEIRELTLTKGCKVKTRLGNATSVTDEYILGKCGK